MTHNKLHWKPALLDFYLHMLHFLKVALSIFFLTQSMSRPTEQKQCRNCFSVNRGWVTVLQLF